MQGQDWNTVTLSKNTRGLQGQAKKNALTSAMRKGSVQTEAKYGAKQNKSAHSGAGVNMKKLEESDELKHDRVDRSLSQAIQQARLAKKWNQKQLATAINEKPQIIGDYESGRAIPNPQIIGKIERALGTRLPRGNKKKNKKKKA
mmetsp:Transcript_29298/g.38520  ORF Transcript_29298/g.38520 Transcript_29298/m.38520 type:complete len:145 (+) Transcript_29298:90-524(+)